MSRLALRQISMIGPGYAITDVDGLVLMGRWQTARDAIEMGLYRKWLLSGVDVIKYDHCARCKRQIYLDIDPETAEPFEGRVWASVETLDSCTPGPNDEDRYHDPMHEAPQEVTA